jgi:hypothetical protein
MIIEDTDGIRYHARLTTEHAASSYGIPVLACRQIGDGNRGPEEALGVFDAASFTLIDATPGEIAELEDAGFSLRQRGGE